MGRWLGPFLAAGAAVALTACSLAPSATPASPPTPVPPAPLRPAFAAEAESLPDAARYDIDLSIDPAAARVTGRQEVRYVNTESVPLSEVYLRLFPNTPAYGGAMSVAGLAVDGRAVTVTAELRRSALRLDLRPPLSPGEAITLQMQFTVTVPTGNEPDDALFSYLHGVLALPNVYPIIPVYDDDGWNVELAPEYGDAVFSDVAFYTVRIAAPSELTLIASGSCRDDGGTWLCVAAPVREFVVILGESYERVSQVVDGVTINSTFYPQHREGGEQALAVAVAAYEAYTDLFGPYPYAELDVVETPNRLGGMEYPGLAAISDFLYVERARLEWVVAHEVAHQWWYGLVGNDPVDAPWLDEGLTQYSTLLYYETAHGRQAAAEVLQEEFVATYERLVALGEDAPAGLPVAAYGPDLYNGIVYHKGALYFHALREKVGEERFLAILRAYGRRYRYGIAAPDSFLAVVRTVSGDEQRAIYERWMEGVMGP